MVTSTCRAPACTAASVLAVDRDRRLAAEEADHPTDERPELRRDGVPDRVRDVDRGRAGLDDRLVDPEQEVRVRPRRVLGAELDLDVPPEGLPPERDPADRLRERRLAIDAELVLEMDVTRGDEDVQVRPLRDLDRLDRALRVPVTTTRERRDRDPAPRLLRDPPHGLEVAVRGGREARLDHVDLEARQLSRDLQLLGRGQAGAGRLLAVAQGRVEDAHAARRRERPGGTWGGCHQRGIRVSEAGCVGTAAPPSPACTDAAPPTVAWASPTWTTTGSRNAI